MFFLTYVQKIEVLWCNPQKVESSWLHHIASFKCMKAWMSTYDTLIWLVNTLVKPCAKWLVEPCLVLKGQPSVLLPGSRDVARIGRSSPPRTTCHRPGSSWNPEGCELAGGEVSMDQAYQPLEFWSAMVSRWYGHHRSLRNLLIYRVATVSFQDPYG